MVTWLATEIPRDAFDQDLLYSFGAFLTFGRVKRENAETRVLAAIAGRKTRPKIAFGPTADEAEEESVEDAPDIEPLAREQERQHVTQMLPGRSLPISSVMCSELAGTRR